MTYRFITQFSSGAYFIPCGVTFLSELAEAVSLGLIDVTNLGQEGDKNHGSTSRHSPHWANGKLWICAFDLGGRDYPKVAEFWRAMWLARDPRVFRFGFAQRGDGTGLSWVNGAWVWTGRDQGHMHGDFAMHDSSIGGRDDTTWWVDVLSSTAPWNFIHWLKTGEVLPLGSSPINNEHLEDDMALVPQNEWAEVRKAVLKDAADSAAAHAVALEAKRLAEVILRKRPPLPGELRPALPAGVEEPVFRSELRGVINEALWAGDRLWSPDGRTALVLQGDGNLVTYDASGAAVWTSKTKGGAMLKMQWDGNLVLYDAKGNAIWQTGTGGTGSARVALQNDRNLVIYNTSGKAVWATGVK